MGLAAGALGFIVNLAPMQAGFGLELLFGGIATFFALRLCDDRTALVVSAVSSLATIILWSHPWASVLFFGETVFIIVLRNNTKLDPLVGVPLYWLLLGLPQGLIYYSLFLGSSSTVALSIIAKHAINALANASIGSLLASATVLARPQLRSAHPLSFRRAIHEVLIVFTILPVMLYSSFAAENYQEERNNSAAERVERSARNAGLRADALLTDVTREAEYISRILLDDRRATALAVPVSEIHLPSVVRGIMVGTQDGRIIASAGQADPDVFALAATNSLQPLQLIQSVDGELSPVLYLSILDMDGGLLAASVITIDPVRLSQYVLPALPIPNIAVSLVASDGHVVASMPEPAIQRDAETDGERAGPPALPPTTVPGFVTATAFLALSGWQAVAHYDVGAYQAVYQLRQAEFLGSLFAIAAVGVFASAGVSRLVTRPLERLSRSIESSPVGLPYYRLHPIGLKEADALAIALETASLRTSQYTAENRVLARRLRSLVTHAPVMLYAAEEMDGRFVLRYVSPGLQEKLGLRLEPGATYDRVHERVAVSDWARVAREQQRLFDEGRFDAEYRIRAQDGADFWVSEVAVLVDDDQAAPREVVGVFIDVTTRRAADSRLQQSAKLITLGEMATGLAHELNQPLNVIRMAAQNAKKAIRKDDGEAALRKLDRIDAQIGRAASLMDHLRIFGRRPEQTFELFDLAAAVTGALSIVAAQLRVESIEIAVHCAAGPLKVLGSMQRLEHGIINLVLNARDAIVGNRERRGAPAQGRISVVVRPQVRFGEIQVADNGGGIDPSVMDKIFEPFVTTKPAGKGTGLGLSLAYGAVVEMGGRISAANCAEGAVFSIVIPLASVVEAEQQDGLAL